MSSCALTCPSDSKADRDAPQQMSRALVDTLAAFHAVDYEALGLSELGRPAGFVQRQVEGWWRRWGAAASLMMIRRLKHIYHWLSDHLPKSSYHSLVHNDYKLDNTMFDADDPARVVAILDWDMCTLGDPLSDLGTLLTYWTGPGDSAAVRAIGTMPAGDFDFYSRGQILQRYAEQSGRDLSNIPFYHVLGIFRRARDLAANLYSLCARLYAGQTLRSSEYFGRSAHGLGA